MLFSEQTYSVLVVSTAQKFNDALTRMLPGTNYYPVTYVSSVSAASRELIGRSYDFVILNAPLPDDFGVRFAIEAAGRSGTVVLVLVREEVYEQTNAKLIPQGIFTLAKPIPTQLLQQGLRWMASARERLRRLEEKTTSIEEKMEEIRLVNRAKWILIEQMKMTEEEAHHHIEKQAMDRCVSRREIAAGIVKTYT